MSVDIESWVHRPVFNIPLSDQTKELDGGHTLRSTGIILELFRKYRVNATFFILGTVAEWYPELIEEIKNDGHEIGIHGYTHTRLCHHTLESFDDEIKKTVSLLGSMGITPRGYRAPVFSKAEFLYEILSKHGIEYDSSIIPVRTPLYNGTTYDCYPFVIDRGIIEIPCSVWKMSKLRIPVGGFYLRLFGGRANHFLLRKIEKRYGISVMYFHPWEMLGLHDDVWTENDNMAELRFLKKQFACYRIPMIKELEYLLTRIEFTDFEGAMSHIDELLSK